MVKPFPNKTSFDTAYRPPVPTACMRLQRQNSAIYHTLYNPALTTFPYCYSTSACVWVCPTDLHKNGSAQLLETFYPVCSRASLTVKLIRTPNRQWNWYAFGSTTTPTSTWNRNRAVGLDWPSDSQKVEKKQPNTKQASAMWRSPEAALHYSQLTDSDCEAPCGTGWTYSIQIEEHRTGF